MSPPKTLKFYDPLDHDMLNGLTGVHDTPFSLPIFCRVQLSFFFEILSGANPTKLQLITGVKDDPKRYKELHRGIGNKQRGP
jgi:hypothetical protein